MSVMMEDEKVISIVAGSRTSFGASSQAATIICGAFKPGDMR
jgi:hypothetical protein